VSQQQRRDLIGGALAIPLRHLVIRSLDHRFGLTTGEAEVLECLKRNGPKKHLDILGGQPIPSTALIPAASDPSHGLR
jgi:hypothetical protein